MTTATPVRKNLVPSVDDTIKTLHLHLEGTAPLLMHAPTLIDPLHPITKKIGELTSKTASKRTVADVEAIARLEWRAALYYDEDLGPFLPAVNVKKAIVKAAGLTKMGSAVSRGVTFATTKLALQYDGPRDPDGLFDAGFVDSRPVRNGGMNSGRVNRTRPSFEDWQVDATLYCDPHEIGLEDLGRVIGVAQRFGVGDYRPEFGLFTATLTEEEA